MAIDYSLFHFSKGQPLAMVRHRRRAAAATRLQKAYRAVDARDHGFCLVTNTHTVTSTADSKRRREHHHLSGRRVMPEWVDKPERIITVTAFVHDLITAKWLIVHGTDARKPITFSWNRSIVAVGREPFRLKEFAA